MKSGVLRPTNSTSQRSPSNSTQKVVMAAHSRSWVTDLMPSGSCYETAKPRGNGATPEEIQNEYIVTQMRDKGWIRDGTSFEAELGSTVEKHMAGWMRNGSLYRSEMQRWCEQDRERRKRGRDTTS